MDKAHPDSSAERLCWFGLTDRGKVRKNNEDAFIALRFDAREFHHLGKIGDAPTGPTDFVFAVSDGMGGANGGEFASRIAVDKIAHLLPRSFQQSAAGLAAGYDDVLAELFERTHASLMQMGQSYEECRGMGATLSLAWFTPGWMFFGHVGDSRIYYLPSGKIRCGRSPTTIPMLAGSFEKGRSTNAKRAAIRGATSCKRPSELGTSSSIRKLARSPWRRAILSCSAPTA
jgi:hypothetical protein